MGAVQLLRSSADNQASKTHTSSVPPPDYHQEASHFEEKLIQVNSIIPFIPGQCQDTTRVNLQVAEMHGELMEFNSHLQYRLQAAERFADRLRTELVHLRGPLPSDYAAGDDDNSRSFNLASSSESPWIHIWIPSTFLVHGTVDSHHVYQVFCLITF